jgi:hypothetical protein
MVTLILLIVLYVVIGAFLLGLAAPVLVKKKLLNEADMDDLFIPTILFWPVLDIVFVAFLVYDMTAKFFNKRFNGGKK